MTLYFAMEILCTKQLQRIARIFELGCSVHHQWQSESRKREQGRRSRERERGSQRRGRYKWEKPKMGWPPPPCTNVPWCGKRGSIAWSSRRPGPLFCLLISIASLIFKLYAKLFLFFPLMVLSTMGFSQSTGLLHVSLCWDIPECCLFVLKTVWICLCEFYV